MKYDLVVIGGGPGGSTAAKTAAEYGMKVCLCEAEQKGRYKCCAGGIPVRNRDFSPIPSGVKEREITGGVLVTPTKGQMNFTTTEENDKGYCMFRTDFDQFLLDLAQDAGAEIQYNSRIKDLSFSQNGVIVKGPQEYKADCVIIATGIGGAVLQRKLGMEVPPIVSALQAEFSLSETLVDERFGDNVWEFFDRSIVEHGIAWAFPKKDAVSIGVLGEGVKKSNLDTFMHHPLLKEKLVGSEMMKFADRKIWGAPIPDRMIAKPFRERVMIIGDACGTSDPILYEGIYQARLSGMISAEIFHKACKKEDFSTETLSEYNQRLKKELYNDDTRYAYKFHQLLFHSNQLEALIDATYSLSQANPEMMRATIALFSGTKTRKEIWKTMMNHKLKLMKEVGLWNGLKLLPSLIKATMI